MFNQEPRNTSDLVVFLGLGEDTFTGNDRNEQVWAGEPNTSRLPAWSQTDDAHDTITTAGGLDRINTGTPGTTNTDVISTGPGQDEITHAGTGTTIDNGPDSIGDTLTLDGTGWDQHLVTVDNITKTATSDASALLRWTNFRAFTVYTNTPLRFVGSDQPEVLHLASAPSLPRSPRTSIPIDVSLNGGDDDFWFYNGVTPGRVDGGTGTDTFAPENGDGCLDVTATLDASYTCTVNLPGEPLDYRVALAGFETYNSFDAIRSATIIGTPGPDTIRVYAPTTTVRGLQGNDSIYADAEYPVRAYLRGDQGADTAHRRRWPRPAPRRTRQRQDAGPRRPRPTPRRHGNRHRQGRHRPRHLPRRDTPLLRTLTAAHRRDRSFRQGHRLRTHVGGSRTARPVTAVAVAGPSYGARFQVRDSSWQRLGGR